MYTSVLYFKTKYFLQLPSTVNGRCSRNLLPQHRNKFPRRVDVTPSITVQYAPWTLIMWLGSACPR